MMLAMHDASTKKPKGKDKRGILQVLWGKQAFKKIVLEPGQAVTLGRTDRADVMIDDPEMSALHFQVWFAGASAVVRDLDSHGGTLINGAMVPREQIGHGGFVVAGGTTFQLFVEESTPPTDEPPSDERLVVAAEVETKLTSGGGDLYGVFDAARDDRILRLLQESVDEHQNLYEGVPGRALDDVAPYLVRFAPGSSLLRRLLVGGWGRGWGTFFSTQEPIKEVRRHFRRYLIVQEEATLERLYFRYYDPRVFREFLKVATPRQKGELLAPFSRVMFEDEDAKLVVVDHVSTPSDLIEEGHVPHS
ncbi:MAG: DUF4123 domain-containing protein [Polyangiaceae bacterium]|nr:DUF4123 domain-containing protein [Polyangiaceae bacterium]